MSTLRVPLVVVGTVAVAAACLALAPAGARSPKHPAKTQAANATPAEQGRVLRLGTLHLLDGGMLNLGSLRGQVVVVNFWASWCLPCRKELPALDALNTELANRGGRVVAVSIDENPENVRRFARERGLNLPIALDGPDGLARALNLPHIPYTLVLDRNGAVSMTSSASDPAALAAVAARARELSDRTPVASQDPGASTP
jgi:thiol-disulfide isomerase/thioredoxin